MVIDEGQQYGTDREIATISLLRTQPLVLWTGDAQQTPGGLARAAPNAKRFRQLLLAKQHGLGSNRKYFMPSTLAEAMAKLLENTSNEGLHLVKSILERGSHVLGNVWTDQLTQLDANDLNAGLPAQFRTATPQEVPNFHGLLIHSSSKAPQSTSAAPWSASRGCYMLKPCFQWQRRYKRN